MAVVRVVMMQRDEGAALLRWLMHYTVLFSPQNITIFDNGSEDPYTLSILKEAARLGVCVRYDLNTPHDFQHKGAHFTNVFLDWDQRGGYDFGLPVDCDEILGVFTPGGLSFLPDDINGAFQTLKISGQSGGFRIQSSLFNVPGASGWYSPVDSFHKGFVSAQIKAMCDNGHHEPKSSLNNDIFGTCFTYLHEHNVDYDTWRFRLKRKLRGLVDGDDPVELRRYLQTESVEGAHAAESLLLSEKEYHSRYDDSLRLYVGDRTTEKIVLEGPSLPPTFWDGDAYRARHTDVATSYELGSLQHYLRHGFKEGRPLR
ncbi:hypothetical protein AA106555_0231 [Neokomagataea thailandica NBRC 106555]|uniref:Glycosyltransferase family 2 protein n=2 Tax=Neokomagataea TaxID=1223423 RepID=A0A4Y6V283_9PROT|nr:MULTISPECIES: glycosyltransferase family 2 protein [Neokomagataea]QDH24139.1 hypothetical protein D5366_01390 [Neokomagataea tanensis]GBR50492.1 hypothetical protein AA106555_0231 [Neokomagataea thailandica NBRC 106555]